MKRMEVHHPYFDSVECTESDCVVSLSQEFPIQGFRLAVVDPDTGYVEIASNFGFRHEDGSVDWVQGHGETFEEAVISALQYFLNLVVHPKDLSDAIVWRDAIT